MASAAPSTAIRLFGTEQTDPPMRELRAGSLSVQFDNGALRYVRFGGVEVLRAIAFLVRDENWGTFAPHIDNLHIEEKSGCFTITYRASCADASRRLNYEARITGSPDGALSFTVDAMPETDVLTNRTGFIVLHPIRDIAGRPVKVVHEDGREERSIFPENVDPRCPFTDIRSLSHEISPGVWATCTMDGDAYEMEDQRNWSDASYKTYVRPLRRPWPYQLEKGQKFTQAVSLSFSGRPSAESNAGNEDNTAVVTIGEASGVVPSIGIGVPADEATHALGAPDLIKRLAPRWLVCQIDLRLGHGRSELERYAALGQLAGAQIVLEIITKGSLDPLAELAPIGEALRAISMTPEAVTVFPAQDMKSVQPDAEWPEMPTFEESYAAARKAFPGVRLGGGMAAYFTELNRKRPPDALLDYVTFTTCPSVHAADDVSVMETLEAIPHLIRSARSFVAKDRPLRIGPSQLGCRENPYGQSTTPNPDNRRACLSRLDPRQRGLFNAAWTVGYVAAAAREGVEAIALSSPTGRFGLIHRSADFDQPWFDDQDGTSVYPAYHVMAGLAQLSGATLVDVEIVGGDGVEALAARKEGQTVLWLANLTAETRKLRLGDPAGTARVSILSAESFERAAAAPDFMAVASHAIEGDSLELCAYAVARVVI